ncbi:MAG TPA: GDSL-type esterase/lipase family protein [Planctomycetota bacterium]
MSVRLLCLGDSITQGRKGVPGYPEFRSFRYPLWKMCVDLGANVEFVGNLRGGFDGDPDWPDYRGRAFPRAHEGHWGWPTHNLRKNLAEWTQGLQWDIVLVNLGTNDPNYKLHPDDSKKELGLILDFLRARNPRVTLLVGLPCPPWKPFPRLRSNLAALVREKTSPDSRVELVDHFTGWISDPKAPGTHTVDWIHPTEAGDLRLAEGWFAALQRHLRPGNFAPVG